MAAVRDYSDLHELIDHLDPEQADELRRHALRLAGPKRSRSRTLRTFEGPATDLGPRVKDIIRTETGEAG